MSSNSEPAQHFLDFDPFSEAFRADPTAFDASLLGHSPGFMVMEGVPSAYVAKFDQCLEVLGDWKRFSSAKPPNMPGMQRVDFFNGQPVMNYSDPPEHDRRRRVVNPAFSPGRVRDLSEATDRYLKELMDKIEPGQAFDGFKDIAYPLSVKLLFDEFLGIPPEDQGIFFEFVSTFYLLDKLKPGDPKPPEYLAAWDKGEKVCRRLLGEAREQGKKNVLSLIASASESGNLSDTEMMAMVCVLFTGGVSTVAAMAASGLHYLAKHPEIAERIRQDQSLARAFCEETLRLDAPVTLVMRFCTEDTQLGDQVITKGMPVYTMISVANRDPDTFENPYEFNIDRQRMQHLAFGKGTHVCVGNAITRMVLPKVIIEAAKRFPDLRLDPSKQGSWLTSARSRHRDNVPLLA